MPKLDFCGKHDDKPVNLGDYIHATVMDDSWICTVMDIYYHKYGLYEWLPTMTHI